MHIAHRTTPIYQNCSVYSPENILMFFCREKNANYYLKNNLAVKLSENPLSIKLTFQPNGLGNHGDAFSLYMKENKCYCCGSVDNLSRHHIVPSEYKREFPRHLRIRDHHDIAPVCVGCHEKYETEATKLKDLFAKKYDAPLHGKVIIDQPMRIASSAAWHLLNKRNTLPEKIILQFNKTVCDYTNKEEKDLSDEFLSSLVCTNKKYTSKYLNFHGTVVMSKVEDIQEFVEIWRKHFVVTMKPKFMPKHWDIKRPLDFRLKNTIVFKK